MQTYLLNSDSKYERKKGVEYFVELNLLCKKVRILFRYVPYFWGGGEFKKKWVSRECLHFAHGKSLRKAIYIENAEVYIFIKEKTLNDLKHLIDQPNLDSSSH